MGIFSKKTKTKQTSVQDNTGSSVTTSQVPDWLKNPAMNIAGNIQTLGNQGPAAFGPQTSGAQQKTWGDAGNLTNSDYLRQSGDALGGVGDVSADQVTGQSLLDGGLDRYYNPFKDQVMNPVLDDFDFQAGQTRAAQAAQAAQGKAFQGSRYGIQEGQTEGALARGRAATEGGLLGDMYTSATGLAGEDAGRRQQAMLANQSANLQASQANQSMGLERARQLGGLGAMEGAETRANLDLRDKFGGEATEQGNAARQYPIAFNGQMGELLGNLNPQLYSGSSTDTTGHQTGQSTTSTSSNPGLLGGLGQIAQIASMFTPAGAAGGMLKGAMTAAGSKAGSFPGLALSDRRVKRDIETVGYDDQGRRWVSFAYLWEPLRRFVGVIAQDILATDPGAVSRHPSGFLQVDYGRL